ncbi:MAG: PAS domain S-box protein, partial [Deltaproteobacteria bacterium]|nr:PAS domain S-box protein [Deltaproteobacteria bacterium]
VREKEKDQLIKGACRRLIATRGYHNCWIALFDEKAGFDAAAQSGVGKKFADLVQIFRRGDLVANARNALKRPGVLLSEDPGKTCKDCPLADQYSGRAALCVRLEHAGRIYGILVVSLPQWAGKDKEEQSLLREIADDIAFALHVIELEQEKQHSAEALKESEARLRSVFEATPLGIGIIRNREMQWHNEAMARMLGYPAKALHGKNARILYESDEEFERIGHVINILGPKKSTSDIETRWVRKDGSVFDCHIRYALLDPQSGERTVLAVAEDISERKKAEKEKETLEAQLNHAQKMEAIGVLAGGVAHDFNNLLTTIIGYADLALMDLQENAPAYFSVQQMRKAGRKAAALTRQLLAFSRRQTIEPEIINLNQILMESEKMLRRLIGEDIDFLTVYEQEPWHVYMDPGQVDQVVMNLVVNARDAMPKGGKLTIETTNVELDDHYFHEHGVESAPGHYVMIAVTDTGSGMDRETQSRIFEPFFTTKEMGRGTGLGLSTVFGIVKQNNGHVWVYSETGKGTTFKVYLPRSEKQGTMVKKEALSSSQIQGDETILLVEDDKALRDLATRMLEGFGYTVLPARHGNEALKLGNDHPDAIHLLLTDVVMPGMDGRDLAEKLQSERPDIKLLFMSGYTDNAVAHHGVLDTGLSFIQKPFAASALARKVREVLDQQNRD